MEQKVKNVLETVAQGLLIFFTFILVVLISLGITFEFEKVSTWEFWVEVLGQFVLTMITFNIIYALERKKRTHDKSSRFFQAYATNHLKIRYIEKNKLYDDLDRAVEEETLLRVKDKCNKKLYKYCSRLTYDDVIGDESIEDILKAYRVLPKNYGKLTKLILKIRAGEITVKKIESQSFLSDKELITSDFDKYDFSEFEVEFKRNLFKSATFIGLSFILAIIGFSFVFSNFLLALIKNTTFVCGGIVSGITSAIKNVKMRTGIYENRNKFLTRYLDVCVEYGKEEKTEDIETKN